MAIDNIIARFELQTGQAQAEIRELTARLDAMDKELKQIGKDGKKGFDDVRKGAESAGGGINSLKAQLTSFAATMGIAFGAQEIIRFTKATIDAAADMGETLSKVGVIFGNTAGDIEAWADTAAERMGQSKQHALDAASTFAIFGKSAGLSGNDLAGFSTGLTELASDMASFNNTSPEQAIQAIGAALRGETEPIRAYGVLLDDASMRQEALAMGLIKSTKEALTPQNKVLAAQALIYKQTTLAQGDFANTADSLSNKQKILSAQFSNFQVELGQKLAPAFEKIVDLAGELLGELDADKVIDFAKAIGIAGAAFGAWKLGNLVSGTGGLGTAVGGLTTKFKAFTMALRANPIGLVATGITLLVGSMMAFGDETEEATEAQKALADAISKVEQNGANEVATATQVFMALQKTTAGSKEREDGIKRINETYGTHLKNLKDEAAFQQQVATALNNVVAAIKQKVAMQVQETKYADVIKRQLDLTENLKKAQEELAAEERKLMLSTSDQNEVGRNAAQARLDLLRGSVKATEQALVSVNDELKVLDETTKGLTEGTIVTPTVGGGGNAQDELIKQLEELEKLVRETNYDILQESLSTQEQEELAVEKKYKAQIDLAKKYANDSTAEGRRYAAVLAALQEASELEVLEIQKKYAELRELARIAERNKEREAEKKRAAERMEFLRSQEEDYVNAYDDAVNALLEKYDKQAITYEEFLKRMAKLDADYAQNVKKNAQGVTDEKQKAAQQLQDAILQSTQLFGETLTNIMAITGRNSQQFAEFSKALAIAEIAIAKGQTIANALTKISAGGLSGFALIAEIATVVASVTSVFASIASSVNSANAPELPQFESYNTGTPYLERGGNPRGIDTIPIMANEGEAIIPTDKNAKYPGMARAWIDGNLEDYIFRNYVIPQLEEQAASAAAARMEAFGITGQSVAGFDDFRLYTQARRQTGALEAIVENTNPKRQSRKRYYS
jgi:hypothetical protein